MNRIDYCEFINIRGIPIFVDFVDSIAHEMKHSTNICYLSNIYACVPRFFKLNGSTISCMLHVRLFNRLLIKPWYK